MKCKYAIFYPLLILRTVNMSQALNWTSSAHIFVSNGFKICLYKLTLDFVGVNNETDFQSKIDRLSIKFDKQIKKYNLLTLLVNGN